MIVGQKCIGFRPSKGVFFALVSGSPPVVKNEAVLPSGVGEGHPLPGADFPHPKLGLQLLVALVCKNSCKGCIT